MTILDTDWTDTGSGTGYLRTRPPATLEPAVELDQPASGPAPAPARRSPLDRARLAATGLGVVAALLAGMLVARPATAQTGARPLILLSAESVALTIGTDPGATVPTAYVWYVDGTRGSAGVALEHPWRPDRPVRMVTVVAGVSCSISIDERLAVVEAAPVNRVAMCVWTAPA